MREWGERERGEKVVKWGERGESEMGERERGERESLVRGAREKKWGEREKRARERERGVRVGRDG